MEVNLNNHELVQTPIVKLWSMFPSLQFLSIPDFSLDQNKLLNWSPDSALSPVIYLFFMFFVFIDVSTFFFLSLNYFYRSF